MRLTALFFTMLLAGCETLGFYGQAAHGEVTLLLQRRAIAAVVSNARTPARTRHALEVIIAARRFAQSSLQLPANGKYTSYVDLHRRYAVWNVFAAPSLSLQPLQWCYPIAGCAVYRGYFDETAARAYATRLQGKGLDTDVGGVIAYSTLGWFDDPVFSTFVGLGDLDLRGLIFHELAHSRVYLPGDSRFNEGFASYVEEEGLARWSAIHSDAEQLDTYQRQRAVRAAFLQFVLQWRSQLAEVYRGNFSTEQKLRDKQQLLDAMRTAYRTADLTFRGRYDSFFDAQLNNARLATIGTYNDLVPAFRALHRQAGNWTTFYERVAELAKLPQAQRDEKLTALVALDDAATDGAR